MPIYIYIAHTTKRVWSVVISSLLVSIRAVNLAVTIVKVSVGLGFYCSLNPIILVRHCLHVYM